MAGESYGGHIARGIMAKRLKPYPRMTFAALDRAGHNLQMEQQELFEAMIGEWLDRVEETRLK